MTDKETCSVEVCERPAHAKGFCNAHYRRLLETGDVDAGRPIMSMPSPRTTASQRLDANSKRADDGCLEWQGFRNRHGYGETYSGGSRKMAHRMAYELVHGPIPSGRYVDHICGNTACIEVSHLRLATPGENVQYQTKLNRSNTSGFRGAYRTKEGRWEAAAQKDGVRYRLGTYETAEEAGAVAARWRAENYRFGEFSA